MAIPAIGNVNAISNLTKEIQKTEDKELYVPFKDVLRNAIDNVNNTQRVAEQDFINVITGQTDDLHTVMINSVKAELALHTLVQLRNKAIDSYNEIMRINL